MKSVSPCFACSVPAVCCLPRRSPSKSACCSIDSLIATQKDGVILLQAKGAVQTGGWTKPRLHLLHGDGRAMTVEFLAPRRRRRT